MILYLKSPKLEKFAFDKAFGMWIGEKNRAGVLKIWCQMPDDVSDLKMPDDVSYLKMPDVDVSDLKMPDVDPKMPDVDLKMPDVDVSDLKIPDMDLKIHSVK